MFPLTCKFYVAPDGVPKIARSLTDELFADKLEIAEAISDALSSAPLPRNTSIRDFIEMFKDDLLSQYMNVGGFDLSGYLRDVHSNRTNGYGDGTEPVLGSLYLKSNRTMLLDWTKSSFTSEADVKKGQSACWFAPRSPFWGRSSNVRHFVTEQEKALREVDRFELIRTSETSLDSGVKTILPCQSGRDASRAARIHKGSGSTLFGSDHNVMNGQCEVFIVYGHYVCAVFHYVVDSAISIPIGFVSRDQARFEAAVELIRTVNLGPSRIFHISDADKSDALDRELGFILRRPSREGVPDDLQSESGR